MRQSLSVVALPCAAASATVELVIQLGSFPLNRGEGILKAETSLDIMTADFKAMLVPEIGGSRRAVSIVQVFRRLAERGVEIRLLHAGTPSSAALRELKRKLPGNLTIRRCPRPHAKTVVIDARRMYLGMPTDLRGAWGQGGWTAEF